MLKESLYTKIFKTREGDFEKIALDVFRYQITENEIYREYCWLLNKNIENVQDLHSIPFLPIEFFKTHKVICENRQAEKIFTSSGTTGQITSSHYVTDLKLYRDSFLHSFKMFFGNVKDYCILALLPSYLEREGSSLVFMVEELMKESAHSRNGFFLYDHESLHQLIEVLEREKQKTLLIGVSFALLDFAEKFPMPLEYTNIMETGGMKGRREEITRDQLHNILKTAFHVKTIYSEYGMTELLSQAYSYGEGKFQSPPWMKILIRDINDPLQILPGNTSGAINIIDLANIESCSFIATSDLGKLHDDGSFEVLGRLDNSDVRGCNLLWEGN